jgi:FkbM family methyltransferase
MRVVGEKSKFFSQLGQDLYVLEYFNGRTNGTFVEVGACHPYYLSNTYYLENSMSWNGLLIEPNPQLAKELRAKRKARVIEKAVTSNGRDVEFLIADRPEFSTVRDNTRGSVHKLFSTNGDVLSMASSTLSDLFDREKVPIDFEFLSIDIEGGELDALRGLNFNKYRPKLICIEHNFRNERDEIRILLTSVGYVLAEECSTFSWDDWYILRRVEQS